MPQLIDVIDSGYSPEPGIETGIFNRVDGVPIEFEPRSLIHQMAGDEFSDPPTESEWEEFKRIERNLRVGTDEQQKDVTSNRYVHLNTLFNDFLLPDNPHPDMIAYQEISAIVYQKRNNDLPDGVTPEDKGWSIAKHRFWADMEQGADPTTWLDDEYEQEYLDQYNSGRDPNA